MTFIDPFKQPHDYNVLSRARMSCYFRIVWLDPPGLIPTDIRYRHILVSVDAMALRNNPAGYVYRIMFKCSGSCMRMDKGPCHLQESNTASELDGSSIVGDNGAQSNDQPAQSEKTRGPKSRKKRPAACDSMLMVSNKHHLLLFHYPLPLPLIWFWKTYILHLLRSSK